MEQKDFEHMYQALTQDGRKGHLMTFDAPTGSGKTYSVTHFLVTQAQRDPIFRAFFVTDQKKNLNLDAFKSSWMGRGLSETDFYQRVGILRGTADLVSKIIAADLPAALNKPAVKDAKAALGKQYALYKQQTLIPGDDQEWQPLSKKEREFRAAVCDRLSAIVKVNGWRQPSDQATIREYVATHDDTVCTWLNSLYPTIDLDRRQLLIMTTAKFIRSYTPFFSDRGCAFQFSSVLDDSLVVLDEFDSTKEQLLDKVIDDALKVQFDLPTMFKELSTGLLAEDDLPKDLRDLVKDSPKFGELQQRAKSLNQKFFLDYSYKFSGVGDTGNFLIHGPEKNLLSQKGGWQLTHNHYTNLVELKSMNGSLGPNSQSLTHMVNRVSAYIRRLNRLIINTADKYMKKRNANTDAWNTGLTLLDATSTFYDALRLSQSEIHTLQNLGQDMVGRGEQPKNLSPNRQAYYFQSRGLGLFNFIDAGTHDLRTEINAAFFAVTPERFLLSILTKANVLGLSATAEIPTVLDNYDLTYMRQRLGDPLLHGRDFLSTKTKNEFDYQARYLEHGITVKAERTVTEGKKTLLAVIQARMNDQVAEVDESRLLALDQALRKAVNSLRGSRQVTEKSIQYYLNRYYELFDSFVIFLTDRDLTSYLGLQMKLPRPDEPTMNSKLICEVFNGLRAMFVKDEEKLPELRIIASNNDSGKSVDQQLKDALQLPAEKETRVYLLSSYKTIGIGQNLQHAIGRFEQSRAVSIAPFDANSNDPRQDQIDLAGVYLGEITKVLSRENPFRINRAGVKQVTQLEYLADAYEISYSDLSARFSDIQKNKSYPEMTAVRSVTLSRLRLVIQALGRANRTFNKMPHIRVLVASNLIDKLDSAGLDTTDFIPEVQQVLALTQSVHIDCDTQRQTNALTSLTASTMQDINLLRYDYRESQSYRKNYQALRHFILCHPTVSQATLDKFQKMHDFGYGLQYLPSSSLGTSYSVGLINDRDGFYQFGKVDRGAMIVSAEQAQLAKFANNQLLGDAFDSANIPVTWRPSELILNPVQYKNLYLGALGEFVGRVLLEHEFGVQLNPLSDPSLFEFFDFEIGDQVMVDFKNWRGPHDPSAGHERDKVLSKLASVREKKGHEWRAMIINVNPGVNGKITINGGRAGSTGGSQGARILEVPGMLDKDGQVVLTAAQRKLIGGFLLE